MGLLFAYCASPLRNPAGVSPVNCDMLADGRGR
jgi:hypothetical protein